MVQFLRKNSLVFLSLIFILNSCKTGERYNRKFNYFQKGIDSSINLQAYKEYVLKENDFIAIQVVSGSNHQDDASAYNLPSSETSLKLAAMQQQSINSNFVIDSIGYINFAKVGKIKAAGLTRMQLANKIEKLISDDVFKPLVVVKLNQFKVSILGEVKSPGNIIFKTEKISLLDVIAEAGDLTEFGKRDDIILLRENNGKYDKHIIDLTDASFINSKLYQMHNNDIVYVNANKFKLKQTNFNPNFQRDLSVILTFLNISIFIVTTFGVLRR